MYRLYTLAFGRDRGGAEMLPRESTQHNWETKGNITFAYSSVYTLLTWMERAETEICFFQDAKQILK